MLGMPADFAAAERPEPVVLYRSLMTDPASTGSAYSALWVVCPSAYVFVRHGASFPAWPQE